MKKNTLSSPQGASRYALHTVTHRLAFLFLSLILTVALVFLVRLISSDGYEAVILLYQAPMILRQILVALMFATGGCLLLEVCLSRQEGDD